MTAGIRAAAQREAKALYGVGRDPAIRRMGFDDGAVWGAKRVTPTRDQLVDALAAVDVPYDGIDFYVGADAILALIAGLAEGESNEPGSS